MHGFRTFGWSTDIHHFFIAKCIEYLPYCACVLLIQVSKQSATGSIHEKLIILMIIIESQLMLSPSGEISVCPGSQPSFRCSTNLSLLEWNVTLLQSGMTHSRTLFVVSTSYFNSPLVVNGHSFRVMRDSVSASLPIISTLTVLNATVDLNGTNIYCTEEGSSPAGVSNTLVASINIITPDLSM